MADWALPTVDTLYTDVLANLKSRDVDAATLGYTTPTNPATGTFRYVRADDKFQEWGGSSWTDRVLAIAGGGTGGSTAATARTGLGLGSIATQNSDNVNLTGGTISGVSLNASGLTSGTVALARGGTGASLALGTVGSVLRSTGSAVAFSTDGSYLTALNGANISSGLIPPARLANITPANFTSTNVSQWTNDAGYVNSATAGMPIGAVIDYAGITVPTGGPTFPWLSCDGSAVSRATYAALFQAIGTTFGAGDGSTTFNLPNCVDRSSLGASGTYPLGTKVGSVSHTHSTGTLAITGVGNHTHSVSGTSGSGTPHTHGSFTGNSGPGTQHSHGLSGTATGVAPPNHAHTFTTGDRNINPSSGGINEGNGDYGTQYPLFSVTNPHYHTGTTEGVTTDMTHTHPLSGTTTIEESHIHGGGTYAVGNESVHTHGGGSLVASENGGHGHPISGSTGYESHAIIAFHKIIKYA